MKTPRLLSFSILALVWIQIFTPSKIVAHTNCEYSLYCHRSPESSERIDYWTNYFFKLLHPEMRHKRVRIYHTLYRREMVEIRRVIAKVVDRSCQQPQINYYYLLSEREQAIPKRDRGRRFNRQNRINLIHSDRNEDWQTSDYYGDELLWDEELWEDGYYWKRTEDYFFEGLYQDLTNGIFYARHPELSKDTKIKANINLATEWNFIRQYFVSFEEKKFLKQHLVPLCNPHIP